MIQGEPEGKETERGTFGPILKFVSLFFFFTPSFFLLIRVLLISSQDLYGARAGVLAEGIVSLVFSSILLGKLIYLFFLRKEREERAFLILSFSGISGLLIVISILRITGAVFISPIIAILPFLIPLAAGRRVFRENFLPVSSISVVGSAVLVFAILYAGDTDFSRLFQIASGGVFFSAIVVIGYNGEANWKKWLFIVTVSTGAFVELLTGFPLEFMESLVLFVSLFMIPDLYQTSVTEEEKKPEFEANDSGLKQMAFALQSYQNLLNEVFLDEETAARDRFKIYELLKRGLDRVSHFLGETTFSMDDLLSSFHPAPFDLEPVLQMEMKLISPYLESKEVGLIIEITDHLPPVIGDETLIRDVLHALLHNAAKYTTRGVISLSAILEGEDRVCIQVSDTGKGISENVLESLLRPAAFSSVFPSEDGGSGVGLLRVKRILRAHSTSLDLNSSPGEGSSFLFVLPLQSSPEKSPVQNQTRFQVIRPGTDLTNAAESEKERTASDSPDDDKPVILAIDDEHINLKVYESSLRNQGYDVLTADNGMDALKILETERVDLVLLDIMMPMMDGYEVCHRIRAKFDRVELPVLFITARGSTDDLSAAFDAGANDFIVKPIDRSVLLSRIQNSLGIKHSHMLRLELEKNKEKTKGLMELNISKDFFLSLISHDLKGGIGSIVFMTERLKKMAETGSVDESLRYIDMIYTTGSRNLRLLSDLLEWSKSQMGLMTYTPEDLLIRKELEGIILSMKDKLDEKNLKLDILVREESYVSADRKMFEAIIRNVFVNAIKFSRMNGKIEVSDRSEKGGITVIIFDSGLGISERVLRQINGKEAVNPEKGTNGEKGNGMGLILVREFMKRHNGSYRIESKEGESTTVYLFFPRIKTIQASLR